jgi:hypothetical protein
VIHKPKGKTTLVIREPVKYRERKITGVLNHEVGTHCIRKINDRNQPWNCKRSKFQMGKFLDIEEGLGCINKMIENCHSKQEKPFLYDAALNYLAGIYASSMSFEILLQNLKRFAKDKDKLFRVCLRVKRGLTDTSQKGGMYKDQLYLIGAVEILRKRKQIDFVALHSGKINLEDLFRFS